MPQRRSQRGNSGVLAACTSRLHRTQALSQSMRGDEKVIGTDQLAHSLERLADLAAVAVRGLVERQDFQGRQHGLQLGAQAPGALHGRAEAQLRGDNDTGADPLLTALSDAVADAYRGSTVEVGDNGRIEQIRGLRHGNGG